MTFPAANAKQPSGNGLSPCWVFIEVPKHITRNNKHLVMYFLKKCGPEQQVITATLFKHFTVASAGAKGQLQVS